MLTSEGKKSALLPLPPDPHTPSLQRKINSSILLHFPRQRSKAGRTATWPERRIHQPSFPSLPPSALCLPRPGSSATCPANSGGLGPTLAEEEGADEEQVELGRFHSSGAARASRAGNLGSR